MSVAPDSTANPHYDSTFFSFLDEGSARSASAILPAILAGRKIASAVDVGCGTGRWVECLLQSGIDAVGVDGSYVDRTQLRIPPARFIAADLSSPPFPVLPGKGFDLAISMEVAEHLPASAAALFVEYLCSLAPLVLFSAAIPGQGGTNHINEQPHEYWIDLFSHHGFVCHDVIRPRFWNDREISWWYAQNSFVFARSEEKEQPAGSVYPLNLRHPRSMEPIPAPPAKQPLRRAIDRIMRSLGVRT